MKALAAAAFAVLRHPSLWGTALAQLWRVTPTRWWRRPPYLPVPDGEYLRFRLHTMYGDERHAPEAEDVLAYLRWCRAFPRANARPTRAPGQERSGPASTVPALRRGTRRNEAGRPFEPPLQTRDK